VGQFIAFCLAKDALLQRKVLLEGIYAAGEIYYKFSNFPMRLTYLFYTVYKIYAIFVKNYRIL